MVKGILTHLFIMVSDELLTNRKCPKCGGREVVAVEFVNGSSTPHVLCRLCNYLLRAV